MAWNVVDRWHLDPSGRTDNAAALAGMRSDIAIMVGNKGPLPKMVFPEGIYTFSAWPNMAFHNLQLEASGQAILRYTGTGDAVTFYGEDPHGLAGLGKRNMVFNGFTIDPGKQSANGLVISSIHASMFKVSVLGAGAPRNGLPNSAICMRYCVTTELHPTISSLDIAIDGFGGSLDCFGITLDILNGNTEWPASACRIVRPVIEGVTTGMLMQSAFYCEVRGGTIEQCQIGVLFNRGSGCLFDHVEMEGNKQWDIWFTKDAHDNVAMYCGDGHRKRFTVKTEGYLTNNQVLQIGSLWS